MSDSSLAGVCIYGIERDVDSRVLQIYQTWDVCLGLIANMIRVRWDGHPLLSLRSRVPFASRKGQ